MVLAVARRMCGGVVGEALGAEGDPEKRIVVHLAMKSAGSDQAWRRELLEAELMVRRVRWSVARRVPLEEGTGWRTAGGGQYEEESKLDSNGYLKRDCLLPFLGDGCERIALFKM